MNIVIHAWQLTPDDINFFKPILFMASDSSSGFSFSFPIRVFHISQNITEGWKEEQTNNMDLVQFQAQEREFCVTLHSPCIRRLSPACILHETSTKGTNNADIFSRWLNRPLSSSSGPSSRLSNSVILWTAKSKPTALLCPPLSTAFLRLPLSTNLLSFLGLSSPHSLPVSQEILN